MNFGSLFAGIGGFDAGLIRAGMTPTFAVEKDEQCNSVRRRHWPDEEQHTDVSTFSVRSTRHRPDLICGGFPCQDVSVAGRRAGLAGERSGLWHEFRRIIAEFRPGWVLIENVPGLRSSNRGRDMGTILGALGELGYRWAYRSIDSQYDGVAQRRERVFIVGSLGDWPHPAEILFDSESVSWNSPPSREAGTDVAPCVRGGIESGSNEIGNKSESEKFVVNCIDAHMGMGGPDDNSAQAGHLVTCPLTTNYHADNESQESKLVVTKIGEQSCSVSDATCEGITNTDATETFVAFDERNVTSPDNRSNPQPGDPCHTLHASAPSIASAFAVRRLLPVECERLQSFPEIIEETEFEVCLDNPRNCAIVGIQSRKWHESVSRVAGSELWLPVNGAETSSTTSHRSLEKRAPVDALVIFDTKTVEIRNASGLSWSANCADATSQSRLPIKPGDFVQQLADTFLCADRIVQHGKAESQAKGPPSTLHKSGKMHVVAFGQETMQPARDALKGFSTMGEGLTRFTMCPPLKWSNCEPRFPISFFSVIHAITGFIPRQTLTGCSLTLRVVRRSGWTEFGHDGKEISDSARYRMLGNAVTVNVAYWLGRRIMEGR